MTINKKRLGISLVILFMTIILLSIVLWQLDKQHAHQLYDAMSVQFTEETTIEYGAKQTADDLLLSYEGGSLKELSPLDTKKIGEQTISATLEKDDVRRTFECIFTVEDTTPPAITFKTDSITLQENESFDPADNIQSIKDPVDGDLSLIGDEETNAGYTITHDVDTSAPGTYTVHVKARDKNKNSTEKSYKVIIEETFIPPASTVDHPSKPSSTVTPTYIHNILIVNKQYALPADYGNGLDANAYAAFTKLQAGAAQAGHSIPLISGYRSYSYQASLYNSYVAQDGQAAADRYSARPGHSEHQSGLAMDVGAIDSNYGNTAAGKWLAAHCADYGFILRYPQGKESITGYMYEPWHIRYVGVKTAKAIMDADITLEEYLGIA